MKKTNDPAKPSEPAAASQSRKLENFAARALTLGATYDAAILQWMREQLWLRLMDSEELEFAAKISSALVMARRQTLAEKKGSGAPEDGGDAAKEDPMDAILGPKLNLGPI